MSKIIYLMGTDGSGKTTLAHNYVAKLKSEKIKIKYLYVRHKPILLMPFKILSRIFLFKKDTEFKNYDNYSAKKSSFSKRFPKLAAIYAFVWMLDYTLYYWVKVIFFHKVSCLIIVDRYVGDVIVNIATAAGYDKDKMIHLAALLHRAFPLPDRSFFIDVDAEVAFNRKNDIVSVKYLQERKEQYFNLKDFYQFTILNGHQLSDELVNDLYMNCKDFIEQ